MQLVCIYHSFSSTLKALLEITDVNGIDDCGFETIHEATFQYATKPNFPAHYF